jgi:F-type H+-transporting ATPase subunit epsilon
MKAVFHLDFVSQDKAVFSGDVREVIAPGADGQLAVLPKHAPLITVLAPGEVVVKREGEEDLFFAVGGGWMEVRPNHVTLLARSAEPAEEIDTDRAERARERAQELLSEAGSRSDRDQIEVALRRSLIRLKVASRHGSHRPAGTGEGLGTDND